MSRARTRSRRDPFDVRRVSLWRDYRWTLVDADRVLKGQSQTCARCLETEVTVLDVVLAGSAFVCRPCFVAHRRERAGAARRGEHVGVQKVLHAEPRKRPEVAPAPVSIEAAPRVRVRTGMPLLSRTSPSRS